MQPRFGIDRGPHASTKRVPPIVLDLAVGALVEDRVEGGIGAGQGLAAGESRFAAFHAVGDEAGPPSFSKWRSTNPADWRSATSCSAEGTARTAAAGPGSGCSRLARGSLAES